MAELRVRWQESITYEAVVEIDDEQLAFLNEYEVKGHLVDVDESTFEEIDLAEELRDNCYEVDGGGVMFGFEGELTA